MSLVRLMREQATNPWTVLPVMFYSTESVPDYTAQCKSTFPILCWHFLLFQATTQAEHRTQSASRIQELLPHSKLNAFVCCFLLDGKCLLCCRDNETFERYPSKLYTEACMRSKHLKGWMCGILNYLKIHIFPFTPSKP